MCFLESIEGRRDHGGGHQPALEGISSLEPIASHAADHGLVRADHTGRDQLPQHRYRDSPGWLREDALTRGEEIDGIQDFIITG
jgi:hypothetical protein